MPLRRSRRCWAAAAAAIVICGCLGGPRAIPYPKFNPGQAARQAVAEFDANGNGQLSKSEAEESPGLTTAFGRIDANGDGELSAEEIADRVRVFVEKSPPLMSIVFEVTWRGQPLENATVTLVPEPFLQESIKEASGRTDVEGLAPVTVAPHDRPFPDAPPGISPGLYRITVQDEAGSIPARYNEATTLGVEVSMDAPTLSTSTVRLRLK